DCDYVKELCKKLDVELSVFSVDVPALASEKGMSVEECGRSVRYECFNKLGCDAIAVAHTLSDSIETMLFNFARGTSLRGVCGIPPKRDNIIRPLIECTRAEIEKYCEENSLSFVTDSTNLLDDYARNKIRHHAVPALKQINPEIEKCALRFFESLNIDCDYIDESARKLISDSRLSDCSFKLEPWQSCHEAVRRQAMSLIISPCLKKPVENRHIELCCRAVRDSKGKVELTKDLYLAVKGGIITIQFSSAYSKEWRISVDSVNEDEINSPYASYIIKSCRVSELNESEKAFMIDADTVKGQLVLRSRLAGDKIKDAKRKNSKTLKKLFCEMKIPPEKRSEIAVLSDDNGVLWVENVCVNADNAVSKNTKRVYIVKKKG
ncbi:MAG: tRNA lysidine(34) synthetase TilS, partial [Acutalibacteraceae bacterium]